MPRVMLEQPARLRVASKPAPVSVDRENRVIRGWIVAQEGPFKSEGRGEFDGLSLQQIVEYWPKTGLKARFSHPNESSDGLGKGVGWKRNPQLSTVTVERGGQPVSVQCVRCDFHLSPSAFETNPNGNLGEWLLDTAERDPGMLSSSLVLTKAIEWRIDKDGVKLSGPEGEPLPPLWRIKKLHASDVVDEGDAVDGAMAPLSAEPRWTRDYLAQGSALIDKLFAGQTRPVVKARLTAFLNRYLDRRYGGKTMNDALGAALGGVLDSYINAAASDERPREVILAEMAQESGLEVAAVSAIVQGASDEGVTTAVLEAFAKVLECPLGELVVAAEEDGIDLTGATTDPAADPATDAPPADMPPADAPAPMSAKPGLLRRKLELKTKTFAGG